MFRGGIDLFQTNYPAVSADTASFEAGLSASVAGSIGIVGIALILSLSNGVSTSLLDIQKKTMSSYPITINQATYNLDAIIGDSLDRQPDRAGRGSYHISG